MPELQSRAGSLAAQRLERSQQRQNLRTTHTSSGAYGSWFTAPADANSRQQQASRPGPKSQSYLGRDAAQQPNCASSLSEPALGARTQPAQQPRGGPFVARNGGPHGSAGRPAAFGARPAPPAAAPPPAKEIPDVYTDPLANARKSMVMMDPSQLRDLGDEDERPSATLPSGTTEVGLPAVADASLAACGLCSLEGLLHENHDKGAIAQPADSNGGKLTLLGMLDGHGVEGAGVSHFCQRNLFAAVRASFDAGKSPHDAMLQAFHETSNKLQASGVDCRFSGTTAVVAALRPIGGGKRELSVGYVGDSRAVLCRQRVGRAAAISALTTVAVTKDHKPTDPQERLRLQEAKAVVRPSRVPHPQTGVFIEVGCPRVWDTAQIYGVAMSRSLGDVQARCPPIEKRPAAHSPPLLRRRARVADRVVTLRALRCTRT